MDTHDRPTAPDTVVLIHGLWMTPLAWEHWVSHYGERGFGVLTPGYPGIEGGTAGAAALREDPASLANLGVGEIIDHLTETVAGLTEQPILIGQCLGGALVQLLLDAGFGAAGVSIAGADVNGVSATPALEIRATLPEDQADTREGIPITAQQFHETFTNALSAQASREAHARYAVPSSRRLLQESGLAGARTEAAVRYNFASDDRAPLLFISGGSDRVVPPALQRDNYDRNAEHSRAISAYKLFPGRGHFVCGEPGWEAVADLALDWALDPTPGLLDGRAPELAGGYEVA